MSIQIWLQKSNSDKFQFPVNPSEVGIQRSYGWESVDLTSMGQYTIGGAKQLDAISLSGFFPYWYDPGYCEYSKIPNPQAASDKISRWAKDKSKLKLTILGDFKYSADVVITGYIPKAQGGHQGDVLFELSLMEFYQPKINKTVLKKVATKPPASKKPVSPNKKNTTAEWVHTVVRGDTLWTICKKNYNDGNRCWDLAKKNNIKNANLIFPGQKLRMWPR